MELFQCAIPTADREEDRRTDSYEDSSVSSRDAREDSYQPRSVRSADHHGRPVTAAAVAEADMRHRGNSLPAGYYTAPTLSSRHRARTHSSRSGGGSSSGYGGSAGGFPTAPRRQHHHRQQQSPQKMQHWGSSLSLGNSSSGGEQLSAADLTRRTLRPPTPSDRRTPSRDAVWQTTTPRNWLPSTGRKSAKPPGLRDYLEKPRLVSTLGCVERKSTGKPSSFHARRMEGGERPAWRNLRLGGFMEGPNAARSPSEEGGIPDVLRQYYLDTYLDGYEFDYLKNFGDLQIDDDDSAGKAGPGNTTTGLIHRGM